MSRTQALQESLLALFSEQSGGEAGRCEWLVGQIAEYLGRWEGLLSVRPEIGTEGMTENDLFRMLEIGTQMLSKRLGDGGPAGPVALRLVDTVNGVRTAEDRAHIVRLAAEMHLQLAEAKRLLLQKLPSA